MNTIKLNLSVGILQNATQEAKKIGVSVQDFIRMLMGSYFASKSSSLFVKANKEIAAGEYTVIDNSKDLTKYLKTLGK